ncbi:MAG TPA: DUF5675 family protein [Dehalococcoidia bacterium]|nr:DUF5675 family protein [Dehalococcoidia bacterium]
MDLFIDRFSYAVSETEGVLSVVDYRLATIERPWIAHTVPGGRPFESCVPDGEYVLEPWIRATNGHEVYILSNPDLGVYKEKADRPNDEGRYLVLMHIANYARNVVGCIGPGIERVLMLDKKVGAYARAVSNSGEAMRILRSQLGRSEKHRLIIRPKCGTQGVGV